mgnify:CR=1 FL=1
MNAIETKGLTKAFGRKVAVDHIDLSIGEGELFALLGVNGAGKTTTIRMLSCLSAPSEGSCAVCGADCAADPAQVKAVVGISPQDTAVAENLTVLENLQFMAQVHGLSGEAKRQRVQEMIHQFRMEEVLDSLGATEAPRIDALNKCDLLAPGEDVLPGAVHISAVTGLGLDELLSRIEEELDAGTEEVSLLIPFDKYALTDRLRRLGSVLSQEHVNEGVILRWRAEKEQINFACKEGARLLQEEIK